MSPDSLMIVLAATYAQVSGFVNKPPAIRSLNDTIMIFPTMTWKDDYVVGLDPSVPVFVLPGGYHEVAVRSLIERGHVIWPVTRAMLDRPYNLSLQHPTNAGYVQR